LIDGTDLPIKLTTSFNAIKVSLLFLYSDKAIASVANTLYFNFPLFENTYSSAVKFLDKIAIAAFL
jgi:hypothetical protein